MENKNPKDFLMQLKNKTQLAEFEASTLSYQDQLAANQLLESITGKSMKEFAPKQDVYEKNVDLDDPRFLYADVDVDIEKYSNPQYNQSLEREMNEGMNRINKQQNFIPKGYANNNNQPNYDSAFGGNSYKQPEQTQNNNSSETDNLIKLLIKEVKSLKQIVVLQENTINERASVRGKEIAKKYLLEQKTKKLIK